MQGFASMSQERRREVATKGGQVAQKNGRAHSWTAEEAREAGHKGGANRARNQRLAELRAERIAREKDKKQEQPSGTRKRRKAS